MQTNLVLVVILIMTWLYDSHIHLSDPEYQEDLQYILNATELLKFKACCVSMDFETSLSTMSISKKSQNILPFIGTHPEMIDKDATKVLDMIKQKNKEIIGIGEIGLDKTYVNSDKDWLKQKKVFSEQLSLAEKFKKPVSIHSRKTLDEIFEILTSFNIKSVLLHWFDGSKNQLKKAMDLGFYTSYGPVLLYAGDKQVLLSKTDYDKILVETDGPVKFSHCFNYKTTQIHFLPSVVFSASKILNIPYNELLSKLEDNSQKFLNL